MSMCEYVYMVKSIWKKTHDPHWYNHCNFSWVKMLTKNLGSKPNLYCAAHGVKKNYFQFIFIIMKAWNLNSNMWKQLRKMTYFFQWEKYLYQQQQQQKKRTMKVNAFYQCLCKQTKNEKNNMKWTEWGQKKIISIPRTKHVHTNVIWLYKKRKPLPIGIKFQNFWLNSLFGCSHCYWCYINWAHAFEHSSCSQSDTNNLKLLPKCYANGIFGKPYEWFVVMCRLFLQMLLI